LASATSLLMASILVEVLRQLGELPAVGLGERRDVAVESRSMHCGFGHGRGERAERAVEALDDAREVAAVALVDARRERACRGRSANCVVGQQALRLDAGIGPGEVREVAW
jgi:hypothetical protein